MTSTDEDRVIALATKLGVKVPMNVSEGWVIPVIEAMLKRIEVLENERGKSI